MGYRWSGQKREPVLFYLLRFHLPRHLYRTSVTYISFACSGATLETTTYDPIRLNFIPPFLDMAPDPNKANGTGILGSYRGAEVPDGVGYDSSKYIPSQVSQLKAAVTLRAVSRPARSTP